jgi:type IV pilus assembly protein PilY1
MNTSSSSICHRAEHSSSGPQCFLLRLTVLVLVFLVITVGYSRQAEASCPEIGVEITLSSSNGWGGWITLDELESISEIPNPGGSCQVQIRNNNEYRSRRCGGANVTATGPAAECVTPAPESNIANSPLFLTTTVEPNLMFIIDDSGSMMWETMPDELTNLFSVGCCSNYMMWVYPRTNGLHGADDYANGLRVPSFDPTSIMGRVYRSSFVNSMYYDPAVTYPTWANAVGSDMPAADPAAAPNRPLFPEFGTRNLTVNNTQSARWVDNRANTHTEQSRTFYPAVYSTYTGPAIPDLAAAIADAGSPLWVNANYTLTEIRSTTLQYGGDVRDNRSDCENAPVCTYAEEIQNFANWYSYHRNRIFAARAGIGQAFSFFGSEMRLGYGSINTDTNTVDGVSGRAVLRGVRPFIGAQRSSFYEDLYTRALPPQGTPLRRALDGAGQYFSRGDALGPWSTTPGEAGGEDLECRQSFSILMTDGYASGLDGSAAYHSNRRANTDGSTAQNTTNLHPTDSDLNYTYEPSAPYSDDRSNTLADVAMYYWKRDLRTDIDNMVPISPRDEAFWQHMVTYGVGLGVAGSIAPADALHAVEDGSAIAWPNPAYDTQNCGDGPDGTCAARLDDLLHAAINSRGGFFSAADPGTFADELRGVLEDIIARVDTSTNSAASSSAVLQSDTLLYTAGFRSGDWSGTLTGRKINSDGSLEPDDCEGCWDAEVELRERTTASRKIFTRTTRGNGHQFSVGEPGLQSESCAELWS